MPVDGSTLASEKRILPESGYSDPSSSRSVASANPAAEGESSPFFMARLSAIRSEPDWVKSK